MYSNALELARREQFEEAREYFEMTTRLCPCWQKPWVSYAQMEKRAASLSSVIVPNERWRRCREVLQRALVLNPASPQVLQAFGLMELQKGNLLPAIRLLERCASFDRRCETVLKWKPVLAAKEAVAQRGQQRPSDLGNS